MNKPPVLVALRYGPLHGRVVEARLGDKMLELTSPWSPRKHYYRVEQQADQIEEAVYERTE